MRSVQTQDPSSRYPHVSQLQTLIQAPHWAQGTLYTDSIIPLLFLKKYLIYEHFKGSLFKISISSNFVLKPLCSLLQQDYMGF